VKQWLRLILLPLRLLLMSLALPLRLFDFLAGIVTEPPLSERSREDLGRERDLLVLALRHTPPPQG
jgi:hypothetical protein